MNRPRLAIAGLTACFGCQLTLLNCEAELFEIASHFSFTYFPMGMSSSDITAEFDAALVEGAVSTPGDLDTLVTLRNRSRLLIAIGTCSIFGGVAAMCNGEPRSRLHRSVYGQAADGIASFNPGPLDRFVTVDFSVTGCPPEKGEILATLASLLRGTFPALPAYPVCMECRCRENACLLIERNEPCLGPVTRAGCNARCPAMAVRCEGCRGPVTESNVAAELELLVAKGFSQEELVRRLRRFCPEWDYGQRA